MCSSVRLAHMMPIQSQMEDAIQSAESIRSILPSLPSDRAVWSISPEASMSEAIEQMTANKIDALVVLSAQKLDGIITREDIREFKFEGRDAREIRVSEIMTRGVYYVTPDMSIDDCMLLMSSRRLRHLPVLEGDNVLSMISIEDVLNRLTPELQP